MVRRRIIWGVALAMAVVVTARADMIPVFGPAETVSLPASEPSEQESSSVAPEDSVFPLGALDPLAGGLPRGVLVQGPQPSPPQPVIILSDEQDSLTLCLYALFSLGLCKSAPWVKRLSFGVIPSWYHEGGPYQIGHSLAISPDCLCSSHICCFYVRLENADANHPMRVYSRQLAVSVRGKSQFDPTASSCRGPPVFMRSLSLSVKTWTQTCYLAK